MTWGDTKMNRFATALSAAIPSSGSDASSSSYLRESPRVASPLDPQIIVNQHRSQSPARQLYDDPRSTRYEAPLTKWDPATHPRRPDLLRHRTDEGASHRARSLSPGHRAQSRERKDQSVRVNVLANRKGGGRLGAMAKGPDDKYAVGGGMALKVVQITPPTSGDATPVPDEVDGRRKSQRDQALGKGPGGVGVTEVVNLWRGSMAVGKGVNDVSWGTGAFSHKLVTASPSGNFLLFDLNRGKLEKETSGGHPRPLNVVRLCQTPAHAHLLITGGTEGQVKMWDLRDREPVNRKYFKHAASVTSLCFSPDDPHQFVVGLENGAIQRYDLRQQKNGRVWGAHGSKAVLDLQWKEGNMSGQGWLASAGADRTVQIWDMSQGWDRGPTSIHTLQTAYPLRRVAWRPQHSTELAIVPLANSQAANLVDPSIASVSQGLGQESVALDEDSHVEIWDVRRHHIAKYALPTIDGTAVEAAWSDSDTLVTAHQNGMFAQLDIRHKTIPLDSIPRQIMSWSSRGEVTYAIDRFKQGEIPFDDPKPEYANHWDKLGQKEKGPADPPYEPLQALGFLSLPVFDNDEFTYLANHYKIEGKTAEELCAWNGEVAMMSGRTDDARCWSLLRQYIEDIAPTPDTQFLENIFNQPTKTTKQEPDSAIQSPKAGPSELTKSPISTTTFSPKAIPLERIGLHVDDPNDDVEELLSDSISSASGSGSITPSINRTRFITFAPHTDIDLRASVSTATPSNPQSHAPSRERSRQLRPRGHRRHSSSEEDDAYPDPYGISIHDRRSRQSSANTSRSSARSSPNIAPHHRVSTMKGSPVMLPSRMSREITQGQSSGSGSGSTRQSLAGSARPSLAGSTRPSLMAPNGKREKSGLIPTSRGWMDPIALDRYKKERGESILQWWRSYVDDGDAQMATVLYVVGSQVVDFPTKQAERVAHCYIEMLEQHRLAIPAAYIRRHAKITSLEIVLGDLGVTHLTYCSRCGKGTGSLEDVGMHNHGKQFWHCKKCRLAAKQCAICQEGVRGLWLGCAKCRHGGHQACMRAFYLDAPLNVPPVEIGGYTLSAVPSADRDYLPLYGYGTSHESSSNINTMDRERTSGETARSDVVKRQTVMGWTGCPQGCGCRCRVAPVERELDEL